MRDTAAAGVSDIAEEQVDDDTDGRFLREVHGSFEGLVAEFLVEVCISGVLVEATDDVERDLVRLRVAADRLVEDGYNFADCESVGIHCRYERLRAVRQHLDPANSLDCADLNLAERIAGERVQVVACVNDLEDQSCRDYLAGDRNCLGYDD